MEDKITIKIDGTEFKFDKNYEASTIELLGLVNTDISKSELRYKNNTNQPKYKVLDDTESIKLKDGMIFKSMPKTITDGKH